MPYVVLLNPDSTVSTLELTKERTTLGSKSDNDLVASFKGVSRHHAHILCSDGQYVVEDLDSTNFVFVEGRQVERHVLAHDTNFSLGDYARMLFLDHLDEERVAAFVARHTKKEPTPGADTTRIIHTSLPKTVQELEALIEVGAHITGVLDLDRVLNEIIDKTLNLMRAERGYIMLLENGVLVPKIARNMETELREDERHSFSRSFARRVAEAGKVLISTNVAEDPRYKSESIISQKILSIMGAPLKHQDQVLGCLYIDVKENLRYFSDQDAQFFTALANQASIAINNARMAENLRKNQIFLEQTNLQLQRSLEKLIETNLKLDRKINEMSVLFDVSKSLNKASDMESVLLLIINKSRAILGAHRSSLMMYDPKLDGLVVELVDGVEHLKEKRIVLKMGEGIAGQVAQTRKGILVNQGCRDKQFKYLLERDANIRQMVCVPLVTNDQCIGVINVINSMKGQDFTEDDLKLLTSLANLAAITIEKFNLYKEKLVQQKLNLELEDAQKVQQLLLPRTMPRSSRFEFSAKYALANRVGGDYYDFIELDDHRLALVIADVSGHDIASALVMAMGRNLIRTLFDIHQSPAAILAKTSLVLRQDTQSSRYITMFLAILDSTTMTMTYSNAGHNYPLYLPRGSTGPFTSLSVGGFPLGLVDDYTYLEETVSLQDNDLLVLYTDGLIEAQSPSGEMFELHRLQDIIREYADRPIEDLSTHIYDQALEFAQTEGLEDDFTFVAVRVKPAVDELQLSLPSKLGNLPAYVDRVVGYIQTQGYFTDEKFNLVLILKEALTNAIEHGNGFDESKMVHVTVRPEAGSLTIMIRDEGTGFDISRVFAQQKKDLYRERGRGLIIIYEYADKVEFNETANEIRIIFYRRGTDREARGATS